MKSVNFQLPQLTKSTIKRINQHLAPYRKQGIRIQHQMINKKHLIHNYGHGSCGITLAYGTAFLAIKAMMIKIDNNKAYNIAILGAGITAIMTGIQLIKRGFKVTLYSQQNFKLLNMDQKTQKSAPLGYSIWFPDGYDYSEDLLKHQLVSKFSYDYLQECIKYKRYRSVHQISVFQFNKNINDLRQVVSDLVFDNYRNLTVDYGNGQQEQIVQYNTILIDNSLYIEQLKTQLVLRGGKFVQTKFNDLKDILKLNQEVIFNCLGPHSKKFFPDQKLDEKPLIQVDLQTQKKDNTNWNLRIHLDNDLNYEIVNRFGNLKVILPEKANHQENTQNYIQQHLFKIDGFFQARRHQAAKL